MSQFQGTGAFCELRVGKTRLIAVYLRSSVLAVVGIHSDPNGFLCLSPLRRRLQLIGIPSPQPQRIQVFRAGLIQRTPSSTEVIRTVIYPPTRNISKCNQINIFQHLPPSPFLSTCQHAKNISCTLQAKLESITLPVSTADKPIRFLINVNNASTLTSRPQFPLPPQKQATDFNLALSEGCSIGLLNFTH